MHQAQMFAGFPMFVTHTWRSLLFSVRSIFL